MIFAKASSLVLHKANPVFELTGILAVMFLLVGLINIVNFLFLLYLRKTKTGWIKGQVWWCLDPLVLSAMFFVFVLIH